ncbi:MAG TPA: hypothetical protein VLJ68_10500, partial [Chitinophagaceae bacterium]|nr:hypothetical protein [Chitinophagaceae bacterium]
RMKKNSRFLLLGLGHGLNDLVAGYFLGSIVQDNADLLQAGTGLLIYNLLAFGGQYPVALWLEKISSPKKALLFAYLLNIAAISSFAFIPQLSIVLAGIASAIYHVAGGTVCAETNKATNIGLFAAPGVAGLILGGYFAFAGYDIIIVLLLSALFFFFILTRLRLGVKITRENDKSGIPGKFHLDHHDLVMILLLTVISLRSVVWNVFQMLHEKNYSWLIAIAIAAFIGKLIGGWMADKIGWRLYLFISLMTATPLISFFRNELILFCIGIGLLQSGIPATTALLIRSLGGKTERGIGLAFGTAIILGAISFYAPVRLLISTNFMVCSIVLVMGILIYITGRKERKATKHLNSTILG